MSPLGEKERLVLLRALAALSRTTGIAGRVNEAGQEVAGGIDADAHVELEANGQGYAYAVKLKRVDRFATLVEIKNQLSQYGDQLLLVAPLVTTELAAKCREIDLQFIDTVGNAYLRAPGLFVLVKGQRPGAGEAFQLAEQLGQRAGSASNLHVFFALLCRPELLNASYRAINQAAGVALGTVGRVFFDLHARGYISGGKGKIDRVLLERQKLVQEWVINYPLWLRPKLNPRRFRASAADWWKEVEITKFGAQWGAEVAAAKLTGYLRPQALTIYFHKEQGQRNLTRLVATYKLRADAQGEIEILDAFWDFIHEKPMPETVQPLLAYADLIATTDPRNLEAAKLIHERYSARTDAEN